MLAIDFKRLNTLFAFCTSFSCIIRNLRLYLFLHQLQNKGMNKKNNTVRRGDYVEIAEAVGCSSKYVEFVIKGCRPNTTETTRAILKAFKMMNSGRSTIRSIIRKQLKKSNEQTSA